MRVQRKCKVWLGLWMIVMGIALTGCGQGNESDGEITAIYIGQVIDESNPNSGVANEAFRTALEDYIGIPVVEIEGVSYLVGIEAMRAGNLDIMLASAFNYIQARQVVDVEILATIEDAEAERNRTLFITHRDRDDINSIEDLEGKSFAFVDASSTTGYLFPKYHLITNLDLDKDLLMQSGYFFNTAVFSGSHNASLMGVSFGDFDGAAVVSSVLDMMVESGTISLEDIKIIGETQEAPPMGYIIRSELPDELIESIRSFFLTYNDPEFFGAVLGMLGVGENARFVEPDEEVFQYVESLMKTLEFGFE